MLLSVVVPAYNEEAVLPEFHKRLKAVLVGLPCAHEILYVNDGSRDRTLTLLEELHAEDPAVGVINFSRNFGKEAAMTAGFDMATGDAIVVIDADLQDPPELIAEMLRIHREEGIDVVYATRKSRAGETWLKRATSSAFYWVMSRVSAVDIPRDTGDFRLMSRRAVDALKQLREHHRFMKGLFAWVGFPSRALYYERDPRFAGDTKWNYVKLWNFSLEAITGFSIAPLKIATYLGLLTSIAAAVLGLRIILTTIFHGIDVPGYPSLFIAVVFFGGVQLFFLGVIGEYLGRVFNESKRRPLYLVQEHLAAKPSSGTQAGRGSGES